MSHVHAVQESNQAGENPWYVLMTIAGEIPGRFKPENHGLSSPGDRDNSQEKDKYDSALKEHLDQFDEIQKRNRRFWNGWASQAFSEESRRSLVKKHPHISDTFYPLTESELEFLKDALASRSVDCDFLECPSQAIEICDFEVREILCVGFVFHKKVVFRGCKIENGLDLGSSIFLKDLSISDTESGQIGLEAAEFKQNFSIYHSKISSLFTGYTLFEKSCAIRKCTVQHGDFYGDYFNGHTSFCGSEFVKSVSFDKADRSRDKLRFAYPPDFEGAKLPTLTYFGDVVWPTPATGRSGLLLPDEMGPTFPGFRYSLLRRAMEDRNDLKYVRLFHKLEHRCREADDGFWSVAGQLSRLYRWTSDYGCSPGRPLAWLLFIILLGSLEMLSAESPNGLLALSDFSRAFALSFANVFSFIGVDQVAPIRSYADLTSISQAVIAIQMVLGTIFIGLFGMSVWKRLRT